jgi:DHA1 family tetracycline resistance protein-like MFS transporter
VISGITAASIATAYAYVADVTPPEQARRALRPLGRRFWRRICARTGARRTGRQHFAAIAVLDCRGLEPRQRLLRASDSAGIVAALALRAAFSLAARQSFRRAGAVALARRACSGSPIVNFLGNLAHAVLPSISVLYMMYRYGWDESIVGLTLAGVGVASIVVQGAVVGPVTKRIGERAALMLGIAFGVLPASSCSLWRIPALNSGSPFR